MVSHYLRCVCRGRAPWVFAGLIAVSLGVSGLLARRIGHGDTVFVWGVLWALLLASSFIAVRIGTLLPSDRDAGRATWLRAHALSPWQHRLAVLIATLVLILIACVTVGLLATVIGHAAGRATAWRTVVPLPLERDPLFLGSLTTNNEPSEIVWTALAKHDAPTRLEVDMRPYFYVIGVKSVDVAVSVDRKTAVRAIAPRGVMTIDVPPQTERVAITMQTPGARLRIASVKQSSAGPSTLHAFLRLALVFFVCMGAMAPIALWCSRVSTATTAVTLGCVLVLFALLRGPLLGLIGDMELEGIAGWAPRVIDGASQLVPRVPILESWRETVEGGVGSVSWNALSPALLYFVVTAMIAVAPWRRGG